MSMFDKIKTFWEDNTPRGIPSWAETAELWGSCKGAECGLAALCWVVYFCLQLWVLVFVIGALVWLGIKAVGRRLGRAWVLALRRLQPPDTLAGDDLEYQIVKVRGRWHYRTRMAGLYWSQGDAQDPGLVVRLAETLRRNSPGCLVLYHSTTQNF